MTMTVRSRAIGAATGTIALLAVYAASGSPLPLYQRYRDAGVVDGGGLALTAVAYFAAAVTALLVLPRLSDHLGRRPLGVAALTAAAAGSVLLLGTTSLPQLLAARFCEGLACGLGSTALAAFVLDTVSARRQWLGTAVSAAGPLVGLTIGALLSGVLVDVTGSLAVVHLTLLAVLLAAGVGVLIAPETVRPHPGALRSLIPRVVIPAGGRRLLPVVACVAIATWALGGFYQAFSPTLAAERLGSTDTLIAAVVFSSYMAPGVLGGPIASRLSPAAAQRIGMAGFLAGVAIVLGALNAGSIALFLAGSVLSGVCQTIAFTGGLQGLLDLTGPPDRAGTIAAVYLISYTGAGVPGLIVGRIGNDVPVLTVALGYGVLAAAATLVTLVFARNPPLPRRIELSSSPADTRA